MGKTAIGVKHPYIVSSPALCGGSPVIDGTTFPVRSVVAYVLRQGMTPEELVAEFPHLTLAHVYDALSYYYDHRDEVDADAAANTQEVVRSSAE